MSSFQQPGKDMLVGSSLLFRTLSFPLQWGTSSACLPQDYTFTKHLPEKRKTGLLAEKWQCRSSRTEGSNAVQDGMCLCLFLAPKYLLLL